ncbi:hypothetical protein CMO96_00160, partial [Candidatus Woesebacteria bacterium]|nr:hypothetical protein [Candidatus Woesebacteria bacterium]
TQNKTKNGVIYYRVSTEDQAQFGVSLEHQQNDCSRFAERTGVKVIKKFHDDGISAKTTNRPGLQAMLKYCTTHSNKIDSVIVYKVDRLSRNLNDYTNILVLLSKLKIKLESSTEAIDETPTGRYIGNIMAASAQFDNDVRSERVSSCMMTKAEKGFWCWKASFGYLNTLDEIGRKTVILDPQRAPLIGWGLEKFATGLYALEDVRRMLNKRGLRTWRGKEISPQLMNRMVRNKFYIGIMAVKGQEIIGQHEHLVDETIFWKCQEILQQRSRGENISRQSHNEHFPLRHFVVCAYCGRPMTAGFSTGNGGSYPYYKCYHKKCPSKKSKSVSKEKFESEFVEYLENIKGKDAFLKPFKAVILDVWKKKYKELNKDRLRLTKRIEDLEQEKLRLIDMKKKDLLDDEDFKISFAVVKDSIKKEQIALTETQVEDFNIDEAVDYVFSLIGTLPKFWQEANYEQKIQLQGLIFPKKPMYHFSGFATTQLSPILAEKQAFDRNNSSKVDPRGIEPRRPDVKSDLGTFPGPTVKL